MRWTVEQYHQAIDAGVFEDRRVQLIDGEIIEMAPQKDSHAFAVRKIDAAMRRAFKGAYTFSVQLPMSLGPDSEPEPDFAVLGGSVEEHRTYPTSALLVIEIADTSIIIDRRKSKLYERADVAEFWIVNLKNRCVEVHRGPVLHDREWRYDSVEIYRPGESIAPVAAPRSKVVVSDLLP